MIRSQRKLWFGIGLFLYWLYAAMIVVTWNHGPDALLTPAWAESWGLIPWVMKEQTSFTPAGVPVYTIQLLTFGVIANLIIALALLIPAVLLWRYLVDRFPVPNGCDCCGYPRRGASETCPECGDLFHKSEPAKSPAVGLAIMLVGMGLYMLTSCLTLFMSFLSDLGWPVPYDEFFKQWYPTIGLGIMLTYSALMIVAHWRHKKRLQSLPQLH